MHVLNLFNNKNRYNLKVDMQLQQIREFAMKQSTPRVGHFFMKFVQQTNFRGPFFANSRSLKENSGETIFRHGLSYLLQHSTFHRDKAHYWRQTFVAPLVIWLRPKPHFRH